MSSRVLYRRGSSTGWQTRQVGKRVHPPTLDDESDLGKGPQLLAETNDTGARGGDMLKAGETMGSDGGAREESASEPNVEREAL